MGLNMSRLSNVRVECTKQSAVIDGHRCTVPNHSFVREITPRGSNGIVFETCDEFLGRKDAVKIWVPIKRDTRDRKRQALLEARKIAQLNHRYIAQIFSCDQLQNGWIYSTMEFLEGQTLREYLQNKQLDLITRVRISHEIEEAIEYSHQKKLYHGDLHDRNVLIVGDHVKIIDFGTSSFALKGPNVVERETGMLLNLGQEILSGYQPRLRQITDFDLYSLGPELALAVLSAWGSVLLDWSELQGVFRIRRDDDELVRYFMTLAYDVCSAPVFSLEMMVKNINKARLFSKVFIRNIPSDTAALFLGCCANWAQTRLRFEEANETEAAYPIHLVREDSENILKSAWPRLRSVFIKTGPFEHISDWVR
jgi:serine/threonine protein kinase